MNTKRSNPIIGMRLEGFQVFDKPTYIPLERLTMLFGPNSAGKSSVQDAIELYEALISGSGSADELLRRHWRRAADNQWVDKLSISVLHTTQCDLHSVIEYELERKIWGDFLAADGDAWKLESRWNLQECHENEDKELIFQSCFEFIIESSMVVKDGHNKFLVNLAHPLLSQTELQVNFEEVAKTYPEDIVLEGGILTLFGKCYGFNPNGSKLESESDSWFSYCKSIDAKHPSSDRNSLFSKAIRELNLLLNCILRAANGNSRFRPANVAASRKVPTQHDLRFQFGNLDDPMLQFVPNENKTYESLAESLTSELTNSQTHYTKHPEGRKFADMVNHALSNHLFMEQGYRLDYDFRLLMSKSNSQSGLIEGMGLDPSEFGFLVEIILRDSKGRRHLFEDVGSGIGYLLPVLCAVYERSGFLGQESTCFIQQPELHIHPALQAAMGDVFIEGSDENHQVLIETHSEHLLLRILKRVRQTHLQATIASELKITAEEVCVLYFDPTPEGTTTIKRLRITEDGEFMDRWPRGFFGERDMELLDE